MHPLKMGNGTSMPRNKNLKPLLVISIAVLALLFYWFKPASKAEHLASGNLAAKVSVTAIIAKPSTLNQTLKFSGPIVGQEEVPVYSDASQGRIIALLVDDGQAVKSGQTLALLDNALLKTQKIQQEAIVDRAKQTVALQQTLLEQAKAHHDQANSEKLRAQTIADTGLLSGEAIEQRFAAERLSQTHIDIAQNNLNIAKADLALSQGQFAETEVRLNQATISSPVVGKVIERYARVGLTVGQTSSPLFVILKDNTLEVEFVASASELSQLAVGLDCFIQVFGETSLYRGKIRHITSKIDLQNQSAKVRVTFDTSPNVMIGQTASVFFNKTSPKALYLPDTAIYFEGDEAYVFAVDQDKVNRLTVHIGNHIGNMIEVVDGVPKGSLVVNRAGAFLHPGQTVKTIVANPSES